MATNLKAINEYKRIFRKILDDGDLTGVRLQGSGGRLGRPAVRVDILAALQIHAYCEGQKIKMLVRTTNWLKRDPIGVLEVDLANPNAVGAIKEFIAAEVARVLKG